MPFTVTKSIRSAHVGADSRENGEHTNEISITIIKLTNIEQDFSCVDRSAGSNAKVINNVCSRHSVVSLE